MNHDPAPPSGIVVPAAVGAWPEIRSVGEMSIRILPGQYYDAETGTSYNYFRDYDPSVGRYQQSDPVGLVGGINTYVYANSAAPMRADPYGLQPTPDPISGLIVNFAYKCAAGIGGAWTREIGGVGLDTLKCCYRECGTQIWKCDFMKCMPPPDLCGLRNAAIAGCVIGQFSKDAFGAGIGGGAAWWAFRKTIDKIIEELFPCR